MLEVWRAVEGCWLSAMALSDGDRVKKIFRITLLLGSFGLLPTKLRRPTRKRNVWR